VGRNIANRRDTSEGTSEGLREVWYEWHLQQHRPHSWKKKFWRMCWFFAFGPKKKGGTGEDMGGEIFWSTDGARSDISLAGGGGGGGVKWFTTALGGGVSGTHY